MHQLLAWPTWVGLRLLRVAKQLRLVRFLEGAISHVHRKHGALLRKLSTNTAMAVHLKHISGPKTFSFTRKDPISMTSTTLPSRTNLNCYAIRSMCEE
jgi:hypothetical protein